MKRFLFFTLFMSLLFACSDSKNTHVIMDGKDTLAYFVRSTPDSYSIDVWLNNRIDKKDTKRIKSLVDEGLKSKKFMTESLRGTIYCQCDIYISKDPNSIRSSANKHLDYQYNYHYKTFIGEEEFLRKELGYIREYKSFVLDGILVKGQNTDRNYVPIYTSKRLSNIQIAFIASCQMDKNRVIHFFDRVHTEYVPGNGDYASISYGSIYRFDTGEDHKLYDIIMSDEYDNYNPNLGWND